MSTNPFSSRERQHFPEFSPMFKRTPSKSEKNGSFRWSIDHIARLKPAEIETDAANLVKTNGHSPENDHDTQIAIDTFFSQKSILPSPWPVSRQCSKKNTKLQLEDVIDDEVCTGPRPSLPHSKKVTFSPLPPATAFIREDHLVESDLRDSGTVDAGTQTMLTFPMNFDLEKLVLASSQGVAVPITLTSVTEEERDVGNSSLRRKLFGQPERQGSSLSPSPTMENERLQLSELATCELSPTFDLTCDARSGNSGGSKEQEHNPAFSSLVLQSPVQQLPDFSPIGSEAGLQTSSTDDKEIIFPVTPKSKSGPTAFKRDRGPLMSPIGSHLCRPSTPKVSPMVVPVTVGCTSTPNTAVSKRQLIVSPFASPVLKHPCTTRSDVDIEPISYDIKENNCHNINKDSPPIRLQESLQKDVSEELAEPLSLGDLRTETFELTNITATTCTSYFTNLELDDNGHDPVAMDTREDTHIQKSTVGEVPTSGVLVPHPQAHSTMVDSQFKMNTNPATTLGPNIDSSEPLVNSRGTSNIQAPVSSQFTFSSLGVDSGVAASVEFNPSVNMSNSRLIGDRGPELTMSLSKEGKEQTSNVCSKEGESESFKTPKHSTQRQIAGERLPMIRENGDCDKAGGTSKNVLAVHNSDMADSGLVFSPDVDCHLPVNEPNKHKAVPFRDHLCPQHGVIPTPHCTCADHKQIARNHPVSNSVLPSRLKLQSFTPSFSPSSNRTHSPGSSGHYTYAGLQSTPSNKLGGTPGASRLGHVSPSDRLLSLHGTPPSRYTASNFVGGALSHMGGQQTGVSSFPDDVLRKKRALKARLQFNNPAHSNASLSGSTYIYKGNPRDHASHAINTRIPVRDQSLGCSRSPLTSVTNKEYSPFSQTLLSPIRSSFLSGASTTTTALPWRSGKSPWRPSSPSQYGHQKENDFMWNDGAKYTHLA